MNHLSEVVKMKQSLDHQRPIFQQIKETIEENILNDAFPEEERVPSTNEFAKMYRINPATAAKRVKRAVRRGGNKMNIEAQLLNRCYGSKQVLKDISLTRAQNKIYGLLCRNGAGKTTLMQ